MQKARLILVDDHAVVRAGIRNALEELSEVEIIGELDNSDSLFETLDALQPDCLLIDIAMPAFRPISAIRDIRKAYPDLRILVVSAYDDDVYVQGLLGVGVDGYHLKDQPLSDLRLAVQRVLSGEKWISSRIVDRLVHQPRSDSADALELTGRQRDLLRSLHKGHDNRRIADELGLSVKTIENHLSRLYKVLNVRSRLEAVNFVMQHPELLAISGGDMPAEPDAVPLDIRGPKTRSILVVDDNSRYRRQLIKMIDSIGTSALIYEAVNAQQAVALTQQTQPRLVLIDVVLGNENGISCVGQLRRLSPNSRIILFSAYPDSEFHRSGLEAGAAAFLDKKNLDMLSLRQILDDVGLR